MLNQLISITSFLGLRVMASPHLEPKPKLRLSDECPVSDEFRKEMNDWLLKRFGMTENHVIQTPDGLFVSPSMFKALKEYNRANEQGRGFL